MLSVRENSIGHRARFSAVVVGIALLIVPGTALAGVSINWGGFASIAWYVSSPFTGCTPGGGAGAGSNVQAQWALGGVGNAGTLPNVGPFNVAGSFPGGTTFAFTCTAGAEASSDTVTVTCPPGSPVWDGNACGSGAPPAVNGAVGPANGVPVSTAPSVGLCNAGTPSAVSGSGPWTWTCFGQNGGTDAFGSAPVAAGPTASWTSSPSCIVPLGGSACSPNPTVTWTSANVANVTLTDCGGGAYTSTGPGPGSFPVTVNYPSGCYQIRNTSTSLPISSNLTVNASCVGGSAWDPGLGICAASAVPVNGAVGSANGVPVSSAPSVGLCNAGTPSAVSGSGPWTWTCFGQNGGTDAFGSAPVLAANIPPSANAGSNGSITLPTTTFTVTTASASDPDGSVSSTVWSQTGGPGATISGGGTLSPTFSNLSSAGSTYTFRLRVTDNQGAFTDDTIQISVSGAPCSGTVSNCSLPSTSSGNSANGSCPAFWSGSCNYTCNNSAWSLNWNLCAAPPPPSINSVTINGAGSATIPSAPNSFTLAMSSSNASSCTWSRTTTNPSSQPSDWSNVVIPGANGGPTQFNANNTYSGWVGPNTVTYTFRCQNAIGVWTPPQSVVLTILTPVPVIDVDPPPGSTSFGSVPVGSVSTLPFTVRNISTQPGSQLSGVASSPDPHFTCSSCAYNNIPTGGSATIIFTFTPTEPFGAYGTNLNFTCPPCAGGVGFTVGGASGVSISPLQFNPPSPITFGEFVIGRYSDYGITLRNISNTALPGFALNFPPGSPFSCVSGCPIPAIPALGSVNFTLRFTPALPAGPVSHTVTLTGRTETFVISGTSVMPNFEVEEE